MATRFFAPTARLAAADPREILEKHGELVHGTSPLQERKVVLSEELLSRGEVTLPRVVSKGGMVEAVFEELAELVSDAGDMDGAEILILVFGHYQQVDKSVIVEYSPAPYPGRASHLSLVESWSWGQLKFPRIRDAVAGVEETSASLLTTACYSGGWELRRLVDGSKAEDGAVDNPGSIPTPSSLEAMGIRQIIEAADRKTIESPRVHTFSFVGTDDSDDGVGIEPGLSTAPSSAFDPSTSRRSSHPPE